MRAARVWAWALCAQVARASVLEQVSARRGGLSTPVLSVGNLTATLAAWPGADVAVFFYSPYGDAGAYSRQVLPLWDDVARWHAQKRTRKLVVAKFSCESSAASRQLCRDVGVRQYPTIIFFGYDRLSFGKRKRAVNYHGLALAESLRDWTVVLHSISGVQRFGDRVLQLFGWRRSPEAVEVEQLRAREALLSDELERRMLLDELRAAQSSDGAEAEPSWDDLLGDLRKEFRRTAETQAGAAAAA
ncbi:hypothetical protein M885DRAFT_544354 [Pelagophyceae sp. CCMP2097]|nr:hypothetical protein M885DRAFT_544354 [Pelagophyceae sp. CCMP2097]